MKASSNRPWDGVLTVAGGCICQFALAVYYLWGSIVVYTTSYYRQWHPDLTLNFTQGIFPAQALCLAAAMPFGMIIANRIGFKTTLVVFSSILSIGLFLSSYATNFYLFATIYSIILGFCDGVIYTLPLWAGWKHYPTKRGFISGIITGGFGFGTIFFFVIAQQIVNPDNLKASDVMGREKFYAKEIYEKVPFMLRVMAVMVFVLAMIGTMMIRLKNETDSDDYMRNTDIQQSLTVKSADSSQDQDALSLTQSVVLKTNNLCSLTKPRLVSVAEILKLPSFWQLAFMSLFSVAGTFFIANSFKLYTQNKKVNDDLFLTILGSVGMIINGVSRCGWGALMDWVNFKKVYGALVIIEVIMMCTLDFVADSKALFMLWVCVILACEGGHFAIFPTICSKMYGVDNAPKVTGMLGVGLNMGNVVQYASSLLLLSSFGYQGLFLWFGGMAVLSIGLLLHFNQNLKFHRIAE